MRNGFERTGRTRAALAMLVVAAGATGSASLVTGDETGTLVPDGTPDCFAKALAPYCTNDDLRRAHGEAGATRAKDYSWDAINGAVAETYLRLHHQRAVDQ